MRTERAIPGAPPRIEQAYRNGKAASKLFPASYACPYSQASEPGLYCAWMAGRNDAIKEAWGCFDA